MEAEQTLLGPLISFTSSTPSTTTATSSCSTHHLSTSENSGTYSIKGLVRSNSGIIIRVLSVVLAAVISIWANNEASKSFDITIVNNAKESPAGQRFNLFYVSNDKAIRIVLGRSVLIEKLLYPNANLTRKQIHNVTLRLATHNISPTSTVSAVVGGNSRKSQDYVIDLSPSLMEEPNVNQAIEVAIQRAMARMWLWDGESKAPRSLIDGMVEYITHSVAGGDDGVKLLGEVGFPASCRHLWWKVEDPRSVATFLHYCQRHREGFIQRLNQAMKDTWQDRTIDDLLGMASQQFCDSQNSPSAGFLYLSS